MRYIKPNRLHEANVQADLYCKLKTLGFEVYLEHKMHCRAMSSNLRADVVIVSEEQIVAIVEVKSKIHNLEPYKEGKQYRRYEALGIPFTYCINKSQIDETVEWVNQVVGGAL